MNGDQRLRVWNRCKYDIGVTTTSGIQMNIRAGGFQVLSVNDILYIESVCRGKKFFSSKMLVAMGDDGKELSLEELGGYADEQSAPHMSDEEIKTMLSKKSAKAIEAWLQEIEDSEELHAIFEVAKKMDLPSSKLKVLNNKMPTKNWLAEE